MFNRSPEDLDKEIEIENSAVQHTVSTQGYEVLMKAVEQRVQEMESLLKDPSTDIVTTNVIRGYLGALEWFRNVPQNVFKSDYESLQRRREYENSNK